MKIAVFSDIHGNPYSTRAVLDDIEDIGGFDAVVLAGDVCSPGSDPATCVDMLRGAKVQVVFGNADKFIFTPSKEPLSELYRANWDEIVLKSRWAAERLGEDRINWLKKLPFELRFSPTKNILDDLLVVHANPKDVFAQIGPPEEIQKNIFGKVEQPNDDPELTDLLDGIQASIIAFGHFHYTSERVVQGIRLVNVSPCSYSRFVSDLRARYTIFNWNDGWQVECKYLEYDYDQERKALLASDMPGKVSVSEFYKKKNGFRD